MAVVSETLIVPTESLGRIRAEPLLQRMDVVVLPYAQLLFSQHRGTGWLLMLATLADPRLFVGGLLSVGLAAATARALGYDRSQIESGTLTYNALLTSLILLGSYRLSAATALVWFLGVAASVPLTSVLQTVFGVRRSLPVLAAPFLVCGSLCLSALAMWQIPARAPLQDPWSAILPLHSTVGESLRALGALLDLPGVDVGLVVLLALALHSRISLLLFVVAVTVTSVVPPWGAPAFQSSLKVGAILNAALTAVALGGVWFVPGPWAYLLAAAGAIASVVLGIALLPIAHGLGIPVLLLPFHLVVWVTLLAMRNRSANVKPVAVDFVPGSPERNLEFALTNKQRFGTLHGLRFSLPVRGTWTCTQGVNGEWTHQGQWMHALDFEVRDDDNVGYRGEGRQLEDWMSYRLPVVAVADGVVVKVVNTVRDNPIGELNVVQNWGNLVMIEHAPGVISLVAHLACGSVTVREGQTVRGGEQLGLCGNSGRSETPHVHYHLQETREPGAPTIPLQLHDVVVKEDVSEVKSSFVPEKGQRLRRLVADADRARGVTFSQGQEFEVELRTDGQTQRERWRASVDLLGRTVMSSIDHDSTLYYYRSDTEFAVLDLVGDALSLQIARLALSRLPLDAEELEWTDAVPARPYLPVWKRPFADAIASVLGPSLMKMKFRARREGGWWRLEARSVSHSYRGQPAVKTLALLSNSGPARIEATIRGQSYTLDIH